MGKGRVFPLTTSSSLYDSEALPAPSHYAHETTAEDYSVGMGAGARRMYSTHSQDKGATMRDQPAWLVAPPMPSPHTNPSYQDDLLEQYPPTATKAGLMTFFPVGNRAAASSYGIEGAPQGLRMLLVPPDRYSPANNRRQPRDVRAENNRHAYSRARARAAPVGA